MVVKYTLISLLFFTSFVNCDDDGNILTFKTKHLPLEEKIHELIKHQEVSSRGIQNKLTDSVIPFYMKQFVSSNNEQLEDLLLILKTSNLTSQNCAKDLSEALMAYLTLDFSKSWAWEMADAWGKPVAGILSGNINALGDPTQCVSAMGLDENGEREIKGRYCKNLLVPASFLDLLSEGNSVGGKRLKRSTASVEELVKMMADLNAPIMIPMLAACWPNSCSQEDTQNILFIGASLTNLTDYVIPLLSNCYTNEKRDLNGGDLFMIMILSIIVIICLSATIIDVLNSNSEKWMKDNFMTNPTAYSKGARCFLSFSLYTNVRKWSDSNSGDKSLKCIHGIRFLSMCWVILGHMYINFLIHPKWNLVDVKKLARNEGSIIDLAIFNATFSVDTFFLLSGTLVSYNIFKALRKSNGKLNFPLLYVHRYLRLTPLLAIIIGIIATFLSLIASAPMWFIIESMEKNCQKNWWHNLLYVNNLVSYKSPDDGQCHAETWYLANDMQMFLFAPFIIYAIYHYKRIGLGVLSFLTISSVMTPFFIIYGHDLVPTVLLNRDNGKFDSKVYTKPWCRAGPYLIGIWLGYLFFIQGTEKSKLNKLVAWVGWIFSIIMGFTLIFGIKRYYDGDFEIPRVESAFYGGFSRTIYSICVAWVIYACVKGYGSIVNSFLSWRAFVPLGRLTYATYLVSMTTQQIQASIETKQAVEYNTYNTINTFLINLMAALFVGFLLMITIESPFLALEKVLFEKYERKNNTNSSELLK